MNDWETADIETEPLFEENWLNALIQRTMHLDLSELTRQPKPSDRRMPSATEEPIDSVAEEVDKEGLLDFVDTYEEATQMQATLAIAHDENVSAWIESISRELSGWATQSALKVALSQLSRKLQQQDPQMMIVKVWLALLLGGFELEQQGDFYLSEIWVSKPPTAA